MFNKTIIAITTLIVACISTPSLAEDAVTADPKHYTVEFENDKIRVIRIKYGPGEKSVMHTHGANLAVFLTENTTHMTFPDGTSGESTPKVGTTQWSDAEEHLPQNLSDHPLELLLVEVK